MALERHCAFSVHTYQYVRLFGPFHRNVFLVRLRQFDLGIPAMTRCCDQLDLCYDTCGSSKSHCDSKFRWCLHSICADLKKSLGFISKVQGEISSPEFLCLFVCLFVALLFFYKSTADNQALFLDKVYLQGTTSKVILIQILISETIIWISLHVFSELLVPLSSKATHSDKLRDACLQGAVRGY